MGRSRSGTSHPGLLTSKRLRRTKLVGAFAVAALVGVGSYAATYHALVLVSVPASAPGSIAPATPGGAHNTTVTSTTATSARPPD